MRGNWSSEALLRAGREAKGEGGLGCEIPFQGHHNDIKRPQPLDHPLKVPPPPDLPRHSDAASRTQARGRTEPKPRRPQPDPLSGEDRVYLFILLLGLQAVDSIYFLPSRFLSCILFFSGWFSYHLKQFLFAPAASITYFPLSALPACSFID